ncbi:MAG: hypothetical protein IKF19_00560 [Bacilli bacterium]|nr:hypothetical protein [Bacilli bacterium]
MDKFKYKENEKKFNYYKNKVSIISSIRLLVFISIIISFFLASNYVFFMYLGFIFIFCFIILIYIHDRFYKKVDYYKRILVVIDEYMRRKNGKWKEFKDNGSDYDSVLLSDLDVVGKNSLFQYLSVCKTIDGRDNLINKLSNSKLSNERLKQNQEAIVELSKKYQFILDFQVSMFDYRDKDIKLSDGFINLDKKIGNKIVDFYIGIFFSFVAILLLVLGFFKILPMNYFYGMFVFNFFINYLYSFIYQDVFSNISKITYSYEGLSLVYNVILSNNYDSRILNNIKNKILAGNKSMQKLVIINDLNHFKDNILSSFIFNGLFSINFIVMYLYSLFLESDIKIFKDGVTFVSELEALISLAGLGIIREDVVMPDICSDIKLKFKNIKHPLIDQDKCVGNDFECLNDVNIITGSNMGGKTSFLRTIGINLILMNAGGFVCSDSFMSCYLKMFTSMRVRDDIDKGISTFYGELLRVKEALDYIDGPRIILIDEIFKGTNYNDRIYGAVSVINKLNDNKTIIFITTHDFELCDIKIDNLNNYYVKEYYEGDNIHFDYKIRQGKCDSTNAKYLMKKIGIIDK